MKSMDTVPPVASSNAQQGNHASTSGTSSVLPAFSVKLQAAFARHALAATSAAPQPIPLPGQPANSMGHDFHERALNLHAYRLQLIASNIANADTPNYKAVDIDYPTALREGRAAPASSPHGDGIASPSYPAIPLQYHVPQQPSIDGNTVELDVERAKFVDSVVRYQFSLDRVSGHYKMMSELLSNLKG